MRLILTSLLILFVKTSFSAFYLSNYNLTLVPVRRLFYDGFREPRAPYPTPPVFAEALLVDYSGQVKGHIVFQQTVTIFDPFGN